MLLYYLYEEAKVYLRFSANSASIKARNLSVKIVFVQTQTSDLKFSPSNKSVLNVKQNADVTPGV